MEKNRAIPEGFMLIGELAKKTGVTIRTLQYYDTEGLLSPSGESEGGFRLYSDKDTVKLIRILMMKELGFPLKEIKERLPALETTQDVLNMLTEQTSELKSKIRVLTESVTAIEALKDEITQMEQVDFRKYAAILTNLQMKNEHYWLVKYMDDDLFIQSVERIGRERAQALAALTMDLHNQAAKLHKKGIDPGSDKAQKLAIGFWEAVVELTDGDMDAIMNMNEQIEKIEGVDKKWNEKFSSAREFLKQSLEIYFTRQGAGL